MHVKHKKKRSRFLNKINLEIFEEYLSCKLGISTVLVLSVI